MYKCFHFLSVRPVIPNLMHLGIPVIKGVGVVEWHRLKLLPRLLYTCNDLIDFSHLFVILLHRNCTCVCVFFFVVSLYCTIIVYTCRILYTHIVITCVCVLCIKPICLFWIALLFVAYFTFIISYLSSLLF